RLMGRRARPARGRTSARRSAPRRSGASGARTPRQRTAAPRRTLGERLHEIMGSQADEVWGIVVLLAAVLAALGIYSHAAGPAGRLLALGTGDVLGWARFLLPPALALIGMGLVRAAEHHPAKRITLGSVLLLISAAGLADLAGQPAHWDGSVRALRAAGGLVGAGTGMPLRAALAAWGAGLVLSVVAAIAILVITGTPVREVAAGLSRVLGRSAHLLTAGTRTVSDAGARAGRRAASGRHPSANDGRGGLYDQETDQAAAGGEPEAGAARGPDASTGATGAGGAGARPPVPISLPPPPQTVDPEQLKISLGPTAAPGAWRLPPLALLARSKATEIDRKLVERQGRTLEDALAAHGVETRLVGMTVGPTVTRYELELGPGVKVAKVTNLQKDIAYAMAAADVRILAPIPGRSAIGVEVPNTQRQLVAVGDILTSPEAHAATHPLEVALGRDIAGRPVLENLAHMPHILIAGATGAGKSSCLNSVITSILVRATPDQVRLILIDPKRVELGQYNGLPHLLTGVVTNPKKAANALSWAVHEMERRYDLLAEVGVRDITGYNDAFDRGELQQDNLPGQDPKEYARLPLILLVVDELNDLMMVAARDVEESICRIAQMARAVGIHLVIATQRPSVDVITGVIKANVPSRLAFAVSSLADSRVILDQPGAERLIGKGDMLLLTASSSVARRIQGSWVDESEVRKVVAHWRRQAEPQYVEGVEGSDDASSGSGTSGGGADGDDDDLLVAATELIVRSQLGSTSMLQRKLRVGFARAGRIMDLLEQRGVVGPSEGSKARAVLMTVEEFEAHQGANA
ncbi:MAG: DNA translocase FtsK 4TM domain-containing protein, partial [Acidimicrobiales bacterium]